MLHSRQVKYGKAEPPDYRLDRVTVPTLLFSGAADSLSTPADTNKLAALIGDAVIHNEESNSCSGHLRVETGGRTCVFPS